MKLIKDWPQAYKWWSVHGAVAVAFLSALYASLPFIQSVISPVLYAWVMFFLGVTIPILRVIKQ